MSLSSLWLPSDELSVSLVSIESSGLRCQLRPSVSLAANLCQGQANLLQIQFVLSQPSLSFSSPLLRPMSLSLYFDAFQFGHFEVISKGKRLLLNINSFSEAPFDQKTNIYGPKLFSFQPFKVAQRLSSFIFFPSELKIKQIEDWQFC